MKSFIYSIFLVTPNTSVTKCLEIEEGITGQELRAHILENKFLPEESYSLHYNGKQLADSTNIPPNAVVYAVPELPGGKGGFGSMLRAIGAQIEKTTNREACRDLSGRRLRDINEEKRLKSWLSKQVDREQDAEARKKAKYEQLQSVPKHDFVDKEYDEARAAVTDKVHDAITYGLKQSKSDTRKRGSSDDDDSNPPKKALWMTGVDDEDTDEDSEDGDAGPSCSYTPATEIHGSSQSKDGSVDKDASALPSCSHHEPSVLVRPIHSASSSSSQDEEIAPPRPKDNRPRPARPAATSTSTSTRQPDKGPVTSYQDEASSSSNQDQASDSSNQDEASSSSSQEQAASTFNQEQASSTSNQVQASESINKVQSSDSSNQELSTAVTSSADSNSDGPLVLEDIETVGQLEVFGLERLKVELSARHMKCGGTLRERAARLFSVRGVHPDKIDPKLLVKPPRNK